MKRIGLLIVLPGVLLGILIQGCFGGTTIHYVGSGLFDPGRDAYKYFRVRNRGPFFIKIPLGVDNHILDPGAEIVLERKRPALGSRFAPFSFMAYAYREYRNGRLDEFVGQQEIWPYVDGSVYVFDGRVFADDIELGECCWYLPSFGHPTKYKGTFIVPWEFNIKTK